MARGGEIALLVVFGVLLAVGLAALTGVALAAAMFGKGWVWPHGTETIAAVFGGLLKGHPGRGLTHAQMLMVPSPVAVYSCIAICELALIAMSVLGAVVLLRYRRPGDARSGMATRSEAAQVLGMSRLRAAKEIIRPDLYGKNTVKENTR